MRPRPKCWRDLRYELRALGATVVRTTGSHEVWRFPDGETFIVVCNHLAEGVPPFINARYRRLRDRRHDPHVGAWTPESRGSSRR